MTKGQIIIERQKRRNDIRSKIHCVLFCIAFILLSFLPVLTIKYSEEVDGGQATPSEMIDTGLYQVEATAYNNPNGNLTASGKPTIEGITVAGPREWLGCTCVLYDEDMNFLGFYEFTDTGYGRDGDIKRGETIDIYFESYADAINWGRRTVYIQVIDAKG